MVSDSGKNPFRPLLQLRWFFLRPLHLRLVPNWVPAVPLPFVEHIPFITVGDVVLMIPLVLLFLAGWSTTSVSPSTESSGNVAGYAIVLTFLLANKANSIFSAIMGLSYERLVPFHNLSALLSVVLSLFHGYVAFRFGGSGDSGDSGSSDRRLSSDDSQFALNGPNADVIRFAFDGDTNLTGTVLTLCMIGLIVLSFFRIIRKYCFDFWLGSHIALSIGVLAFGFLHSVSSLVFILLWWLVDICLRYVGVTGCRYPTSAKIVKVSPDVCEVRFRRTSNFMAGQFVRIAIPALGPLQFHPITISSAPYETEITLHIKAAGDWSRRLVALADQKSEVHVLVEGPYGNWSTNLDDGEQYPMVLCVSGGIGSTPCRSITRQLLYDHKNRGRKLDRIQYIWAVRGLDLLPALAVTDDNLSGAEDLTSTSSMPRAQVYDDDDDEESDEKAVSTPNESSILSAHVYVTKDAEEDAEIDYPDLKIRRGRPDLSAILENMEAEALRRGIPRVAVLSCGPPRMVNELKLLCRAKSKSAVNMFKKGVVFDFHEDVFEY